MRSFGVVQINVLIEVFNQVREGVNGAVMEVLIFDDVIDTFQKSVVKTGVSHRDLNFVLLEFLGVQEASILGTAIGMMNEFIIELGDLSQIKSLLQGIYIGLGKEIFRGFPTENPPGVQILNQDDIAPLALDFEIGDIAGPYLVDVKYFKVVKQVVVGSEVAGSGYLWLFEGENRFKAVSHPKIHKSIAANKIRLESMIQFFE